MIQLSSWDSLKNSLLFREYFVEIKFAKFINDEFLWKISSNNLRIFSSRKFKLETCIINHRTHTLNKMLCTHFVLDRFGSLVFLFSRSCRCNENSRNDTQRHMLNHAVRNEILFHRNLFNNKFRETQPSILRVTGRESSVSHVTLEKFQIKNCWNSYLVMYPLLVTFRPVYVWRLWLTGNILLDPK